MAEIEQAEMLTNRIVTIVEPASCYVEQYDALVKLIEARDNAVRVALLDAIAAEARELAGVTDGRTCPGHCYAEAIREMRDKYQQQATSGEGET
jgi:hypothetical protein